MKTKSLFRMIVAIVTVMLLSCISTSAYAQKKYVGTYTFTDSSKKTYTLVLKPGNYSGKGVLYYKGKIVDYLSWQEWDTDCAVTFSDVKISFPGGNTGWLCRIKGGYLYQSLAASEAEHPKKRLKITKK